MIGKRKRAPTLDEVLARIHAEPVPDASALADIPLDELERELARLGVDLDGDVDALTEAVMGGSPVRKDVQDLDVGALERMSVEEVEARLRDDGVDVNEWLSRAQVLIRGQRLHGGGTRGSATGAAATGGPAGRARPRRVARALAAGLVIGCAVGVAFLALDEEGLLQPSSPERTTGAGTSTPNRAGVVRPLAAAPEAGTDTVAPATESVRGIRAHTDGPGSPPVVAPADEPTNARLSAPPPEPDAEREARFAPDPSGRPRVWGQALTPAARPPPPSATEASRAPPSVARREHAASLMPPVTGGPAPHGEPEHGGASRLAPAGGALPRLPAPAIGTVAGGTPRRELHRVLETGERVGDVLEELGLNAADREAVLAFTGTEPAPTPGALRVVLRGDRAEEIRLELEARPAVRLRRDSGGRWGREPD